MIVLIINKAYQFIKQNNLIKKDKKILVAVSGGPDSVFMLSILHSLKERLKAVLHVVHVNHMLRGAESDTDREFVVNLCKSMNIECHVENADVKTYSKKTGKSIEEAARDLRYGIFENIAQKISADYIAVAHNLNDLSETVLFNVLRGSGIDGLKGMPVKRGRIIRPVLFAKRDEIIEYLEKNNIKYRIDSSNKECDYTRNKIRNNIIPHIEKQLDLNIALSLSRLSKTACRDAEYLNILSNNEYINCVIKENNDCIKIDSARLKSMHEAVISRIIRMAVLKLKGSLKDFGSINTFDISELVDRDVSSKKISLPGNIKAMYRYNILYIYKEGYFNDKNDDFFIKLNIPGNTVTPYGTVKAEIIDENIIKGKNKNEAYLDFKSVPGSLYLRNRKPKDHIYLGKNSGTKTIKKYFIDEKVPKEKRDKTILLAKNSEVLWIAGFRTNDKYRAKANSEKVLKLVLK